MSKACSKQSASTEGDSCDQRDEQNYLWKTNPRKHKTELCKTYSQLGYCNYGIKCRFAHGREELVCLPVSQHFRKRKCNGFWRKGYCLYGIRCQFGHAKIQWEDQLILKAFQQVVTQKAELNYDRSSKLLKLLRQK